MSICCFVLDFLFAEIFFSFFLFWLVPQPSIYLSSLRLLAIPAVLNWFPPHGVDLN